MSFSIVQDHELVLPKEAAREAGRAPINLKTARCSTLSRQRCCSRQLKGSARSLCDRRPSEKTRVRKKAGLKSEYGRGLMLKAFGETGPLMPGDAEGRKAGRELFAGAISFCKNPSSHHEIDFEDPREVIDMVSFANQLLRIVDRL